MRIAKLVPPHADKHYSFQVLHRNDDDKRLVRVAMQHTDVAPASPFLQGCSENWLMVEFWCRDKEVIDKACRQLSATLELPYVEGDFTREEVFPSN